MQDHECGSGCAQPVLDQTAAAAEARPLPVVDIHAHISTPQVERLVAGHPARLVELKATAALQGVVSTDYNRTVMLPACLAKMANLKTRIADMDAMGVDVQVISPSPGQYYYWADEALSGELVTLQNEHIAQSVAHHPDRLVGMAAVSLQHPVLAAKQLRHAVRALGLRGVEISTSARGLELGDHTFDPFWAAAEELGVVVFLHPLGSSLGERLDTAYLGNTIGQPIETTIALSHIIFGGVLDRCPGVKIVAAHGGGYLPTYSSRSDHAWHARPDARTMAAPLSDYLKRIWFDNLVYTPEAVSTLIERVGVDRVLVGTDYPFDMGAYDVLALAESIRSLSAVEREGMLGGNALALLGLDAAAFRNARALG